MSITFTLPSGISATDNGIYLNDRRILPLVFDRIQRKILLTDRTRKAKFYCDFHIVTSPSESIPQLCEFNVFPQQSFPSYHGQFCCSLDDIPACLQELHGLFDLPLKREGQRLLYLSALQDIFQYLEIEPGLETVYISDRSGWFQIDKHWFYFTSEFAIGKEGLVPDWHCETSKAYLKYGESLCISNALRKLLEIFDFDFDSVYPIWAQSILAHLRPLRTICFPYPMPALLLTGNSQSFKTQLSFRLGKFLTDSDGNLEDYPSLQSGIRSLQKQADSLSDTLCFLDDAYQTHSQAVQQKLANVLESSVRNGFSSSSHLAFLITGEPGALDFMGTSWVNRTVEINFSATPEQKEARRAIVNALKLEPLLCRTCLVHFLQFTAGILEDGSLSALSSEIFQDLEQYFPRPEGMEREFDNYTSLFWAHKIFLRFAVSCHAITSDRAKALEKHFAEVLKKIALNYTLTHRAEQWELLLEEVFRNLKIHPAQVGSFSYHIAPPGRLRPGEYYDYRRRKEKKFVNIYGHQAIIDSSSGYNAVYLENTQYLLGVHHHEPAKALLIVEYENFAGVYQHLQETARRLNPSAPYAKRTGSFLKELRSKGILLTESRFDKEKPDRRNYRIPYPFWTEEGFDDRSKKVIVFRLTPQLKKSLEKILQSKPDDAIYKQDIADDTERVPVPFYENSQPIFLSDSNVMRCASILHKLE